MNNNRNNNNNRRRGRGNRQQGGGNQNRIDSRARGNAPQLLDKYKKLAQDAAHNGDRVQAEYYLQFADHYFRVIADNKARQDEQRGGGRTERDDDDIDDGDEFDVGGRPQSQGSRDRDRANERGGDSRRQRDNRRDRDDRDERDARPQYDDETDGATEYEPSDNPFVRDNRSRGRDRDGARDAAGEDGARRPRGRRGNGRERGDQPVSDSGEIDVAALPPSFSASAPAEDFGDEADAEAGARRKLAPRRRKPAAESDEGDPLKAVG